MHFYVPRAIFILFQTAALPYTAIIYAIKV
jgi:hypothetical protein